MYRVKSMTLSDQRVLSTYITLITATTALVFHLFGPLISIDPNIEQEINNPKNTIGYLGSNWMPCGLIVTNHSHHSA